MRDLFLMFRIPAKRKHRYRVLEWVKREWHDYADHKYPEPVYDDKWIKEHGFAADGEWVRQITQYWGRGQALGLETPAGQQAILKSITTLVDGAAAMIRVYGDHMPVPGYPSGEVHLKGRQAQKERS